MNILIVGSGKGSWIMRGQQIGAALGARVSTAPTDADFAWADVVVLVKRAGILFAPQAHRHGKPIVWDALDFWRQPDQNTLGETAALAVLRAQIAAIRPVLTIGATEAMATACDGVCLPHHAWSGLTAAPVRDAVSVVAYEGNPAYLGRWSGVLAEACRARGWTFVVNPPDLRQADILVAFRDGPWDGWICREWKSGVKAVNAIVSGRPLVAQASAAVRELGPDGSVVEQPSQLEAAFDLWADRSARDAVVRGAAARADRFSVATIANEYRAALTRVAEQVAA